MFNTKFNLIQIFVQIMHPKPHPIIIFRKIETLKSDLIQIFWRRYQSEIRSDPEFLEKCISEIRFDPKFFRKIKIRNLTWSKFLWALKIRNLIWSGKNVIFEIRHPIRTDFFRADFRSRISDQFEIRSNSIRSNSKLNKRNIKNISSYSSYVPATPIQPR